MKYNEKYDLYLDDDLVIYYWSKKYDKLMQRPLSDNGCGYLYVSTKIGTRGVHRIIYETFIGEIPDGYEIDHINTIRTDNRLENLRCVTCKENHHNILSLKHLSEASKIAQKGNKNAKGMPTSEFGRKFKEHFGISKSDNINLYTREHAWYRTHNKKCRWE